MKSFKLNWAWFIGVLYTAFALTFIGILLYSFTQKVELVTDDYYQKDLVYQSKIDAMKRTNQFADSIVIDQKNKQLTVQLPREISNQKTKGNIQIYRPSDSKLDKNLEFSLDTNHTQEISADLKRGLWTVKLSWSFNDSAYYYEKQIFIN
jgi:hypothetical protein